MIDPEKIIFIPESERWLLKNPEVGVSCSISKTHRDKGLKPLVTELSGKSLCNLNVRQLNS
jgi:hypothetical protein